MTEKDVKSRQLALLGILLQCLHMLFGITAVIGVLIAHTRIHSTTGTVYYSQLRWQLITFWVGLIAYALAFYLWVTQSMIWPLALVFTFVLYRLIISIAYWRQTRALERTL